MAGLAYGARHAEQWGEDKTQKSDFFAVKGDLESLLAGTDARFAPIVHPALHPGRAAEVRVGPLRIGVIGELHPKLQQQHDLPLAPILFEIDLASLLAGHAPHFQTVSKLPAVRRDIALLFSDKTPAQTIIDTIDERKLPYLVDFSLFDLYVGNSLAAGQKSLALRIVMQDTEKTLTDLECDTTVSQIVKVLHDKFGATLRK
jgi:phenylalanyl-tRNA synthetase beta chain